MADKIFVSYNHNDQYLIDTMARKLSIEFGQNNIFYDKWSIQPGESVIEKMNVGLTDFNTFFLFASENSLKSPMVSLEWQTALKKAVKENLKFVVVRISNCTMPTILTNLLYIDLFSIGIDEALQQMKDTVNSVNIYRPLPDYENLQAKFFKASDNILKVFVEAKKYSEQNATIFLLVKIQLTTFGLLLVVCGL